MNILGRGRKSTIYEIDNNQILKLYDEGFPKFKVLIEYEKTRLIAENTNILTPKALKLIEKEEKFGIIFSKIVGKSLMELMMLHPYKYFQISKTCVTLHKELHNNHCNFLESQESRYKDMILNSDRLSAEDKGKLVTILTKKYDPVLCHGDFHHGNIMLSNDGRYYIIDWSDAFSGSYLLDVSLSAVNGVVSSAPDHIPSMYRWLYNMLKSILRLDNRYLSLYGVNKSEVKEYLYLASAIHLIQCEDDYALHEQYFKRYKSSLMNVG